MIDLPRRALSIRQPWAELVLAGAKSLEIRSRPTKVRGLVQVYAALRREDGPWQLAAARRHSLDLDRLTRGLLVGVVDIVGCRAVGPADSLQACFEIPPQPQLFGWMLANPQRFETPTKPNRQPQPSFFFVD